MGLIPILVTLRFLVVCAFSLLVFVLIVGVGVSSRARWRLLPRSICRLGCRAATGVPGPDRFSAPSCGILRLRLVTGCRGCGGCRPVVTWGIAHCGNRNHRLG